MAGFDYSSFSTPTNISQQGQVTYNGDLGKTTYFGGSSTSSGLVTGITDAFKGIASKLGGAGLSAGGALSGLFGGFNGTNIVAELKDGLPIAPPVPSKLPYNTPSKTTPPGVMSYPSNYNSKYYIQLTFSDRFQANPLVPRKKREQAVIILPMPSDLVESFNMNYSEKTLGMLGVLEEIGLTKNENLAKMMGSKEGASEVGKSSGGRLGEIAKDQGPMLLARYGVKALGVDSLEAGLDRVTGTVLNPYQELQFEGVSLREHTFTYTFSPNSEQDAANLFKIIKELKVRMHPALNGLMFNFPDSCTISFAGPFNDIYTVKESYLKSMSVNYAPSGTPAFFKRGSYPVEVNISLTFGEIKPLSRNTFTGEANDLDAAAAASKNIQQLQEGIKDKISSLNPPN